MGGFELVNADCILIGERPADRRRAGRDGRTARRRDGRRHRSRHGAGDDDRRPRVHRPRRGPCLPGGRSSETLLLTWPSSSRRAPSGPASSRTQPASRRASGPSSCTTTRFSSDSSTGCIVRVRRVPVLCLGRRARRGRRRGERDSRDVGRAKPRACPTAESTRVVEARFADEAPTPNVLCALQILIAPEFAARLSAAA